MKKIVNFLKDAFTPKDLSNLDVNELLMALNDSSVRKIWMYEMIEDLKRLNLEVDKQLLSKDPWEIKNLAVRRRAYQDILESVLSAKRRVRSPNPRPESFDPESVTVLTA